MSAGEETGRDGCVDREDWRDEFKIWLDVMSGDRKDESAGERQEWIEEWRS